MSGALIVAISSLVGAGVFLVTSRSLSRIVLGFALLGHAAVVALLASGGRAGAPPIANGDAVQSRISDPLPQAFSLTAIVISFGLTLFVLALARRQETLTGDDLVEDDVEDRRIADLADSDPRPGSTSRPPGPFMSALVALRWRSAARIGAGTGRPTAPPSS